MVIFLQRIGVLVVSISLLTLVTSCASSGPFNVYSNRQSLNHLEIGMSKSDVLSIMGDPFQREVFLSEDQRAIEVLLYQIHFVGMAMRASDQSITPVVLQDGRLIGWGRNFYDRTKRYEIKQQIEIK